MGVDIDLVMLVKDRTFLPSKDQLYAILALYDKYHITEFGFPANFDRNRFLDEVTKTTPIPTAVLYAKKLLQEVHPHTESLGWGRWIKKEGEFWSPMVWKTSTAPPANRKPPDPRYWKLKETCQKFELGFPAAYACFHLENQTWNSSKMDFELYLPIRPGLSEELRQELYNSPEFENSKNYYPNIRDLAVLSDNDVVLRILPDLLLSPYDNALERSQHASSHVLLLQQNFGNSGNSSLGKFIAYFEKKYMKLLEELGAIVGQDILVTEFLS